jgi:hypothetical protein
MWRPTGGLTPIAQEDPNCRRRDRRRRRYDCCRTAALGRTFAGVGEEAGGPLLVPLSPKEKDSDDGSDVLIMSSVGDAPRGHSPTAFGPDAPQDEGKSSSTSTSSSSSSSERTEQSASPSATVAEKDDFVAAAEEDEEEEPDSSSYRVTPEEPRAAVVRL